MFNDLNVQPWNEHSQNGDLHSYQIPIIQLKIRPPSNPYSSLKTEMGRVTGCKRQKGALKR